MGRLRNPLRAARLQTLRAGDKRRGRELPRLRIARPPPRHPGLANLPRLAVADRPGRGGRLLHRDQARVDGRSADHGHPPGRQRGALPDHDHAAQSVQRHASGPHPGRRPARAAGLHRRAVRWPGQGLLPHRHHPLPGSPGDQPGQARRAGGDRGLTPVQLRRVPRHPAVQPGPDRCRHARCAAARSEHVLPRAQVRQRLRRDEDGQRRDRPAHQRRQPPGDWPLLGRQDLHGPRARLHPAGPDRAGPGGRRAHTVAQPRRTNAAAGRDQAAGAAAGRQQRRPPRCRRCPSIRPRRTATSAALPRSAPTCWSG